MSADIFQWSVVIMLALLLIRAVISANGIARNQVEGFRALIRVNEAILDELRELRSAVKSEVPRQGEIVGELVALKHFASKIDDELGRFRSDWWDSVNR